MRRCANLGRTAQRQRRRTRDPMAAFDALPPPLRAWLSRAAGALVAGLGLAFLAGPAAAQLLN